MATRGYNSYRGRVSAGKKLLIAALVLLLLAAAAFLYCQNYLVYDDEGNVHLELPWSKADTVEQPEENPISPDDVQLKREEPKRPGIAALHARELPFARLKQDTADLKDEKDALVVNIKRYDGAIAYDTALELPEGVKEGKEATLTNLKTLLQGEAYTVARISSLADTAYAHAQMEQAGLLRDDKGDVWYDANGECWLDPTKEDTLSYITALCKECVTLGFDEIMLDYFCYPTSGNVSRIFYGENTDKTATLLDFSQKLRDALPRGTVLSVALHQPLQDDSRSGVTKELLQAFDRVYADSGTVEVSALEKALPASYVVDGRIVPMVRQAPQEGSYMLIG